jgi:hypothetical protein
MAFRHVAKKSIAHKMRSYIRSYGNGRAQGERRPGNLLDPLNESGQALIESPKLQALKHGPWLPAGESMQNRDPKHITPHGVGTKRA